MNESQHNKWFVIFFVILFIVYLIWIVKTYESKTYDNMNVDERIWTELQGSAW